MNIQKIYHHIFKTSIGNMTISCTKEAVIALRMTAEADYLIPDIRTPLIDDAVTQIHEYLDGKRKDFDLPLAPKGTDFQLKVWNALKTIPYGCTKSYAEIAAQIGNPKACRAVGMANNRNPIIIIIPCHRVIGKNGSLVGYACGLDMKQKLLTLETQ